MERSGTLGIFVSIAIRSEGAAQAPANLRSGRRSLSHSAAPSELDVFVLLPRVPLRFTLG
jgi:hypothetical protein